MSLPAPYSEVYLAGDGVSTVFAFGDNFDPISDTLVECKIYFPGGYETVPTFTVDMTTRSITISALTQPDGTVLTAPPVGSVVRIYRDEPEAQNVTASQLQSFTAKQLESALDAIVAMIQEVSYTVDHKTVRLTEPQRDIALQELSQLADQHLIYWDFDSRKLVVTNFPQQDVVRCVNGLFFRVKIDPDTQHEYLQWSLDESDWHSVNVEAAQMLAQDAYDLADDAFSLATNVNDDLNTHEALRNNPHQTSFVNLIDTEFENLEPGQFVQFDGLKWKNVYQSTTVAWGGIEGDILDQTDLMAEFAKKLNLSGGTMTGDLAFQYNTSYPVLRIIQSGQNTNHLRFINNSYASQSISFDLSQAAIHPLVTGRGHLGTSTIHFGDAYIDKVYTGFINNGYDIAVPVTNSADTLALVDKDINPLQQQINHLQTIGRFLSFWDATTGLAQTNPQTSPYIYKTGDYFRVGVVASGGGTNYKPSGSSYTTGVASTTVETERLSVGQVYYYDGTNWALAAGGNVAIDETTIVFNSDNELQAVATVNKNTAAGATNSVFDWVGTLAQYQAQNIETLHPDWLCYITDDVSGGESVYTKSQVDSLLALKVSTGHEVIEFQAPTAENNYTWYRKYRDGWVEQGGVLSKSTSGQGDINHTVTLPVEMSDSNYTLTTNVTDIEAALSNYVPWQLLSTKDHTTTSFKIYTGELWGRCWQVSGMAA